MAGVYPNAPALHRLAYERDGTVGAIVDTNTAGVTVLTLAQLQQLNDEDTGQVQMFNVTTGISQFRMTLIFPELRDITHYQFHGINTDSSSTPNQLQSSVDTTNGYDGTWLTVVSPWIQASTTADKAAMRSPSPVSVNVAGIKALRWGKQGGSFTNSYQMQCIHIYGAPSAGQNPNRLRLWHPTLDQEVVGSHFDWGDCPRSSSADVQFRLKNNSATLTANTITVSFDAMTDASPSVPAQFSLEKVSAPGFTATVQIPTLVPGATSEIITMRRVTPSTAVMSLWFARVLASAATWT